MTRFAWLALLLASCARGTPAADAGRVIHRPTMGVTPEVEGPKTFDGSRECTDRPEGQRVALSAPRGLEAQAAATLRRIYDAEKSEGGAFCHRPAGLALGIACAGKGVEIPDGGVSDCAFAYECVTELCVAGDTVEGALYLRATGVAPEVRGVMLEMPLGDSATGTLGQAYRVVSTHP